MNQGTAYMLFMQEPSDPFLHNFTTLIGTTLSDTTEGDPNLKNRQAF